MDVRELQQGIKTGIGRVVEAFITETPKIDPQARLFLYADKTTHPDLQGDRVEVRTLGQPAPLWFDQVALPMALTKDRVDVFFSPYYNAPVAAPCPSVVTIHDILFLKFSGQRIKNTLFKPWAKFIASRVARILTDSDYSRRDLALVHNSDRGRELAWPRLPSSDHLGIRHPERRHGVENLAPDPCLTSLCRQPSRSHR